MQSRQEFFLSKNNPMNKEEPDRGVWPETMELLRWARHDATCAFAYKEERKDFHGARQAKARVAKIDALVARIQKPQSSRPDLLRALKLMAPEQRLEITGAFCHYCGQEHPATGMRCQCWNDD